MTLRVVAIPLIAAICLGSPATASTSTDDEQQVKGGGARDRGASRGGGDAGGNRGSSSGDNRGGNSGENRGGNRTAERTAQRRNDGEQRTATRSGDRGADPQRVAVPRDGDQDRNRINGRRDNGPRNNGPIVITRNRPNININIGSSFRGPRYYAPVHYDRWARQYYRWSPIGFAPWSLIYGSIGFSNFGYYGSYGPNPLYGNYGYGYGNGYGSGPGPYSPWQASGYEIGGVRLRIRPRDAQVFVDGYYAGLVDDFDGTFQSLRLEQGPHKIEVRMPGFQTFEIDVHVQAGRTLTIAEDLHP
jgi:hypothetical protein